jgi:hypothetical protein
MLLGDGHTIKAKDCKTARLGYKSIMLEMVNHLAVMLPFKTRITTEKATVRKIYGRTIYPLVSYSLCTVVDLAINKIHDRWYNSHGKRVPEDLVLTPINVKYWWYGDGSSSYDTKWTNRVRASFATQGFTLDECDMLIDKFRKVGIFLSKTTSKSRPNQAVIRCRGQNNVDKLFDFIGSCDVECYRYKWKQGKYQREPAYLYPNIVIDTDEYFIDRAQRDIDSKRRYKQKSGLHASDRVYTREELLVYGKKLRIKNINRNLEARQKRAAR